MNAPMTLEQIIALDAAFCDDVSITLCRSYQTVTIHDMSGTGHDDIFMQGDDACQFIDDLDALIEAAPDVLFDHAIKHLAKPYVENIWN